MPGFCYDWIHKACISVISDIKCILHKLQEHFLDSLFLIFSLNFFILIKLLCSSGSVIQTLRSQYDMDSFSKYNFLGQPILNSFFFFFLSCMFPLQLLYIFHQLLMLPFRFLLQHFVRKLLVASSCSKEVFIYWLK